MTVANSAPSSQTQQTKGQTKIGLASRLVNGILAIAPLFNIAKQRARKMMIERAESMGVNWLQIAADLQKQNLDAELAQVQNPNLTYPEYYLKPFHAYEEGNLGWLPATEVESAAYAVHSRIWNDDEPPVQGDSRLRQSYIDIVKSKITNPPQDILDIGCSVGMSTFALHNAYPEAKITGLDLSPHFLAIANYNTRTKHPELLASQQVNWLHATAESTGLPDSSFDFVSCFLIFHELPQEATRQILREMRRILRPNGYFTLMDMNPASDIYKKMPPYILTLLKSTEPYLDQYFSLDLAAELVAAGFETPTIIPNTPRHRTVIAKAV
ncbi:class I SAM-dependent methyltransferase [Pseudanabaena sp. FACHB-1998]|uniref:class I SAM-dependent methyltransferase n=1 Tax=Pseudanabaena sp. FACHB-1998 TaxID=2692858 RepID=UPI0016800853|nr:class I SAM-dependent methyltransferase [Pseudanabaena sp. FACHB-1998]MBD2177982.1 class I SAM-dependent methyltransferase [Pseudanabaena sp. FACHB-1998]